jgi:hypothetical protein
MSFSPFSIFLALERIYKRQHQDKRRPQKADKTAGENGVLFRILSQKAKNNTIPTSILIKTQIGY